MNCALCDSTENIREETLATGWDRYLNTERDFYIFSSVSVPICELERVSGSVRTRNLW